MSFRDLATRFPLLVDHLSRCDSGLSDFLSVIKKRIDAEHEYANRLADVGKKSEQTSSEMSGLGEGTQSVMEF